MHGRYWVHVIAAGLLAVSGWSLPAQEIRQPVLKDQPVPEAGQQQRAQNGQQDAAAKEQDAAGLLSAIKGIEAALREHIAKEDKAESERKEQREIKDLKAQEDMARWAERMFWATIGSLILTAVGVGLILWNLFYARDMARTSNAMAGHAELSTIAAMDAAQASADAVAVARQTLVAQQRPWIAVSLPELRIRQIATQTLLEYRLEYSNFGNSPALVTSDRVGASQKTQFNPTEEFGKEAGGRDTRLVIPHGGSLDRESKGHSVEQWRNDFDNQRRIVLFAGVRYGMMGATEKFETLTVFHIFIDDNNIANLVPGTYTAGFRVTPVVSQSRMT